MNAAIIILIIIIILAILAGIGVGLYFLLRPKTNNPSNGGGTGGTGPNQPPPGPPSPPAGNTGTIPPNIVPGTFSINSVADPSKYLTIGTNPDPTSTGNPPLIGSSDTSIPCTNYSWQNLFNYNPFPGTNSNVPSALVSNITTLTEGNFTQVIPPYFLAVNLFGSPPSVIISKSAVSSIGANDPVTWNYNATRKTWCAPSTGSLANTCLYLETDNSVSSRTFNATDNRFQWNNVAPLVSPQCLPS